MNPPTTWKAISVTQYLKLFMVGESIQSNRDSPVVKKKARLQSIFAMVDTIISIGW